jgi:iron complex transport system substrate-binding protein
MKPGTQIKTPFGMTLLAMTVMLVLCPMTVSAITVTDDAGTTITLNTTPERIVSLSPSNTEILAALGLLDKVVGVTDVCDYPPEVINKTRVGGYSAISIEKVAAVKPDLVIASDKTPRETVSRIKEIGVPVIVVAPKNVDHVIRDIGMIGRITGTETQAEDLAANITRRIAKASAVPGTNSPTVAHVVYYKPLYVSGNTTMQNDIISRTGGINVFANRNGWRTVSLEEFLLANPDIIIVSGGGGMDTSERDVILDDFMTNSQYTSLSAVKNHHVYAINADIISRPGPRIADAAEEVSGIISAIEEDRVAQQPVTVPGTTAKTPGFSAIIAVFGFIAVVIAIKK